MNAASPNELKAQFQPHAIILVFFSVYERSSRTGEVQTFLSSEGAKIPPLNENGNPDSGHFPASMVAAKLLSFLGVNLNKSPLRRARSFAAAHSLLARICPIVRCFRRLVFRRFISPISAVRGVF